MPHHTACMMHTCLPMVAAAHVRQRSETLVLLPHRRTLQCRTAARRTLVAVERHLLQRKGLQLIHGRSLPPRSVQVCAPGSTEAATAAVALLRDRNAGVAQTRLLASAARHEWHAQGPFTWTCRSQLRNPSDAIALRSSHDAPLCPMSQPAVLHHARRISRCISRWRVCQCSCSAIHVPCAPHHP